MYDNDKRLSILLKYQAESVDAEVSEYRGETIEIASLILNIVSVSVQCWPLDIAIFIRIALSLCPGFVRLLLSVNYLSPG